MSLPSRSTRGTSTAYCLSARWRGGAASLSLMNRWLASPVYLRPGMSGKPASRCGSGLTSVPDASDGKRLGGGSLPLAIQPCMATSSARIASLYWFGLTGFWHSAFSRDCSTGACCVPAK